MTKEEYAYKEFGKPKNWREMQSLTEVQFQHNIEAAFEAGQYNPSRETARAIWDAAISYQNINAQEAILNTVPNFDTFYKQLMEGK